jgi:hypothetical protein
MTSAGAAIVAPDQSLKRTAGCEFGFGPIAF